jgi:hypothetical protein
MLGGRKLGSLGTEPTPVGKSTNRTTLRAAADLSAVAILGAGSQKIGGQKQDACCVLGSHRGSFATFIPLRHLMPVTLMGLAKTEQELAQRTSRFLKEELKRADVTYEELAKRLKKHGLPSETQDSIKGKLKRGTFAATFFLACLAALELEGVQLEDI